jgi:hypothetical protein
VLVHTYVLSRAVSRIESPVLEQNGVNSIESRKQFSSLCGERPDKEKFPQRDGMKALLLSQRDALAVHFFYRGYRYEIQV